MHNNSLAAYDEAQETLSKRAQMVYEILQAAGIGLTDRQVMHSLGFHDMNTVRPRITELIKLGYVEECGNVVDPATEKRVRLVRVKAAEPCYTQAEML